MLDSKPCGKKRKLRAANDCVLDESKWKARKPSHLTVEFGFLPEDDEYKTTVVSCPNQNAIKSMSKCNKELFVKKKLHYKKNTFFVIDRLSMPRTKTQHYSKFHSVLQILLANLYRKERFVAMPVHIAGTTSLSSTHDTIFDLSESEFIFEYHRKSYKGIEQRLPMIEQGLHLRVGLTSQLVKQTKLLQRIHAFLQRYRIVICPSKRPLLSINESFAGMTNFALHYECLHLLVNRECLYSKSNGSIILRKDKSAFECLYDVWVCCYLPRAQQYTLRYLPAKSWDEHQKGFDVMLYEFSDEIDTLAKRNKLEYWANKAAVHYDFHGVDFVLPEYSLLYQDFVCNCINAWK